MNQQSAEQRAVVNRILKDVEQDLEDEALVHRVLDEKISQDPAQIPISFGQQAADKLASFAGSWKFLLSFIGLLILWMIVNVVLAMSAFDPYPFILLNLVLSCVAAIQAPIIMMSQNRQNEKDRSHAENDFQVNLKTEFIIEDIHNKLDSLLKNQHDFQKALEKLSPAPKAQEENKTKQ